MHIDISIIADKDQWVDELSMDNKAKVLPNQIQCIDNEDKHSNPTNGYKKFPFSIF
jgi:hypothetical protein